ncbi:hypothetical protein [Myroides pelagicus]|uniref:DUF4374 domain-containing protein n=1 Tax=Myroides pelagicus TaxID=270914 RepID=A0A7K1GK33_9FLAO|nr:hypothetical protein [Myroides pelagicus]MTH29245.1 hypothetical protein [Myroides pelagicus]
MSFKFRSLATSFALVGMLAFSAACSSDDSAVEGGTTTPPGKDKQFQLAFASGSGSESAIYMQGVDDVTKGTISFSNSGYQLPSSRTARIFVSDDGKYVYSLNYTVGDISKLEHLGGQNYKSVAQIDSSPILGVRTGRFTKVTEDLGSIHYIKATAKYSDQEGKQGYLGHSMVASIALLDLDKWAFTNSEQKIEVKIPEELAKQGYYISRIDSPVLSGDKLYYGASASLLDLTTGKRKPVDKAFTLVVDKNDLTKTSVLTTDHVEGTTNGYRTPTLHKDEQGAVLQMVNGNDKTYVTKLVNGAYDKSFIFDLGAALGGKKVSSNGWFYVGNGIGYMPYQKLDEEGFEMGVDPQGNPTKTNLWGLARIDLNNKTAVDLNVPNGKLWLTQYQTSIVRDGKFYIALSEVSGEGNIYIFDVASNAPEGVKGAKITSGKDQYYIGVY